MSRKVSTAVSHLAIAGVTGYCLYHYHSSGSLLRLPVLAYGIVLTHSAVGIIKWLKEEEDETLDKIYTHTKFFQTILAMPCIAGQVWLNAGHHKELGYAHPGLAVIPFAAYLSDKSKQEFVDVLIAINCISCALVSFNGENHYGIATGVIYLINHFGIQEESEIMEVPSQDFYNYTLAGIMWCASRAL